MANEVSGSVTEAATINLTIRDEFVAGPVNKTSAGTMLHETHVRELVFVGDEKIPVATRFSNRMGTQTDVETAVNAEFSQNSAPERAKAVISLAVDEARDKRNEARTKLVDDTEKHRRESVGFGYFLGMLGGVGTTLAITKILESRGDVTDMSRGNIALTGTAICAAILSFIIQDAARKDRPGISVIDHIKYIEIFEKAAHAEAIIQLLDSQLKPPQDEVIEVELTPEAERQPTV